jgi:uncharacterized protein (TIGR02145 family)
MLVMKNILKISGIVLLLFLVHTCCKDEDNIIKDADGNVYTSVIIGTQTWMAENLKTTKYNDGSEIPYIIDEWAFLTTDAYCWYNNDSTTNKNVYGALYNWYAVNKGKLCPEGWHVPSDSEWTVLTDYLGGESTAGGRLKEIGTSHWRDQSVGATNDSGFTALTGGYRDSGPDTPSHPVALFWNLTLSGYWWTSTSKDEFFAWFRDINSSNSKLSRGNFPYRTGFSVRCLKN